VTTNQPPRTDALSELADAAMAGDARAIEAFVKAAGPPVVGVARKILGVCHPDVEDVVQEALFAALDALPRFRRECSVLHFVCRVAVLTSMNARRRLRLRELIASDSIDVDERPGDDPTPMGHALSARRRDAFRRLLDDLPPEQAEVLALHCVLGYTVAETALSTGVPANTVRSRLITAKNVLRQRMAADAQLSELMRGVS
jgi:RNA polymerase sigma-70 factor (ECF subfamily)